MNKKIAIKGNGFKTISFLKSLGGINVAGYTGVLTHRYYYINENNHIVHSENLPKGYTEIISLKNYQKQVIKQTINYSDI